MENNEEIYRENCYKCHRPKTSCMCKYIKSIKTDTKFIILMHPKEFQKTKNGSGHLTNLSLQNSKIFIGIDFTNHKEINTLINDTENNCYILYPGTDTIKLNTQSIKEKGKNNVIFIIDSTWACSKKILRVSKNLHDLQRVSFEHTKHSNFKIKTQPNSYCLSTMESTLCVLELLNIQGAENIPKENLAGFLKPFEKMVEYQVQKSIESNGQSIRYKKPYKKP